MTAGKFQELVRVSRFPVSITHEDGVYQYQGNLDVSTKTLAIYRKSGDLLERIPVSDALVEAFKNGENIEVTNNYGVVLYIQRSGA
jgi:hypothetical protein